MCEKCGYAFDKQKLFCNVFREREKSGKIILVSTFGKKTEKRRKITFLNKQLLQKRPKNSDRTLEKFLAISLNKSITKHPAGRKFCHNSTKHSITRKFGHKIFETYLNKQLLQNDRKIRMEHWEKLSQYF